MQPDPVGHRRSGPQQSPGFLLWRVTLRWQRSITNALKPLGLTHVQFVLLANVWWMCKHPAAMAGGPNQRQVAERAGTDEMMTSQVLRALESSGLLTRTVGPADARTKLLGITPRGRRLAELAVTVVEQVDAAFFADVAPSELLPILQALADGSDRHGAPVDTEPPRAP